MNKMEWEKFVDGILRKLNIHKTDQFEQIKSEIKTFGDLNKFMAELLSKKEAKITNLVCSNCNVDINYIRETGRMGCPDCYKIFGDVILKHIGLEGIKHVGKRPKGNEIKQLEDQMAKAIAVEDYEQQAARIRDKIKEIKNKG